MEQTARLIATASRLPEPADVGRLAAGVAWIEIRADRAGEPPEQGVRALLEGFGGGLVYTLRSRAEGGDGPDDPRARAEALTAAGARDDLWDLIDLEAERDLHPSVLDAIDPSRRILSWHGPPTGPEALEERLATMERTPARFYKLIPAAVRPGEELAPLLLLEELATEAGGPREDVIAFASGPAGLWTRLVAPRLGAPVVFGALPGDAPGAPGQPTVDRLVADYGLPALPPVESLFGVIGRPVAHSLSPRLHNRAYRELGVPALYLAFHAEHFGDFWIEVVESGILDRLGMPLRGLSVTAPFKDAALAVAGAPSPRTGAVGAANTLVLSDGVWEAESTDPEGVVLPLRNLGVELDGAAAVVIGAGGAGRAAVIGLGAVGARVTLVNRSVERGRQVAGELGVPFVSFAELSERGAGGYRIVVQATPLGRGVDDPLPLDPETLDPDAVVVDMVYTERETPLVEVTRRAGRLAIDGREVLLFQGLEQFRMMTGRELPLDLGRRTLGIEAPDRPRAVAETFEAEEGGP